MIRKLSVYLKSFSAFITDIRFISRMQRHMLLQHLISIKALLTFLALIEPFTSMSEIMISKVTKQSKTLSTGFTSITFLFSMDTTMRFQISLLFKWPFANFTLILSSCFVKIVQVKHISTFWVKVLASLMSCELRTITIWMNFKIVLCNLSIFFKI